MLAVIQTHSDGALLIGRCYRHAGFVYRVLPGWCMNSLCGPVVPAVYVNEVMPGVGRTLLTETFFEMATAIDRAEFDAAYRRAYDGELKEHRRLCGV